MSASSIAIRDGLAQAHWRSIDLWLGVVGIGGELSCGDIDELVAGRRAATPGEHDILACAFNDHFTALDDDRRVRYWRELEG